MGATGLRGPLTSVLPTGGLAILPRSSIRTMGDRAQQGPILQHGAAACDECQHQGLLFSRQDELQRVKGRSITVEAVPRTDKNRQRSGCDGHRRAVLREVPQSAILRSCNGDFQSTDGLLPVGGMWSEGRSWIVGMPKASA